MDHVQIDTPNWDTKVRCSCGADFTSRCEFYKHGYEALLIQTQNKAPKLDSCYYCRLNMAHGRQEPWRNE